MCGIAGFCSTNVNNKQVILSMNERIYHRGPDAGGFFIDESNGVTFGHRRLSIVDLTENGAQPFTSQNGRYVIDYNGEIYNAIEIREKLLQDGKVDKFRGTSDTEVLIEAISAFGTQKALQMTKGMFAIALYDKKNKTITLSRDRVGEKPLYFGTINGDFVFSSDLSALKVYPGFKHELNREAVKKYLHYGYVPSPISIYEGIFKCKPGHFMIASYPYTDFKDDVYYDLAKEYMDAKEHPFKGTFKEAVSELDRVMKNAVKSQMMSDVPLGAFLSGGIDSSAVVSLMQSVNNEKTKTFTIGFEDKEFNEADEAAEIAKYLGTDHTSLMISQEELKEVIPKIPDIFTEPFADSSQIPTYLVSKLARSKVTVSLSGDAGDELFAGYNTYWKISDLYKKMDGIPSFIKKAGGELLGLPMLSHNNSLYRSSNCLKSPHIAAFHEAVCYDTTYLEKKLLTDEFLNGEKRYSAIPKMILPSIYSNGSSLDIEDEMMLRDLLNYHPDDILVKVDRAGMAVSLENRVPMLDKDVLKLAFSLPVSYKLGEVDGKLVSKYVLKEMLYQYVPKDIMNRPKKGFSVPLNRWLTEGSVHEWAENLLQDSFLVRDHILDGRYVEQLFKSFMSSRENKGLLWNVLVLEQWYRRES